MKIDRSSYELGPEVWFGECKDVFSVAWYACVEGGPDWESDTQNHDLGFSHELTAFGRSGLQLACLYSSSRKGLDKYQYHIEVR